ncbi:hypothetical protein ACQ4PT_048678 [Festuca glaucescens]
MMILFLLILAFEPIVAADKPLAHLCHTSVSYMNDSTYYAKIELLSTVQSKSTWTLLSKGFVGTGKDRVYGVAMCRGDSSTPSCQSCIAAAFHDTWQLCGPRDETHGLYEYCIIHISTADLIYNSNDVLNRLLTFTDNRKDNTASRIPTKVRAKYTDVSIDDNIKVLLQETAKQAAYNSTMRYATGSMDVNSTFPLFYSLAQCNLDLLPNDCWDCLDNIRSKAKSFFYSQSGEWISGVWCNFMYTTYQFYKGQPMQHIAWSASANPTTNMTAPVPAPGPVGVPPRQKDKNKQVVVPSHKHKSKIICSSFPENKVIFLYCCYKEHFQAYNQGFDHYHCCASTSIIGLLHLLVWTDHKAHTRSVTGMLTNTSLRLLRLIYTLHQHYVT